MNKLKLTLAFALIFLLGAAAGGAGGAAYVWRKLLASPSAGEIADRAAGKLQSRLHLSAPQTARIRPILLQASTQGLAIRRDTLQRLKETLDDLDAKLLVELTPEQRKLYADVKRRSPGLRMIEQTDAGSRPVPRP